MESTTSLLIFRSPSYLRINEKTDLPVFSPYLLRRAQPTARLAYPPASSHFSNAYNQYRNFHLLSIAYAFRPGLRSRLTLRGRAFLRNPWAFDGRDSHSPCATYANILACVVSSAPYGTPSSPTQRSSTGSIQLTCMLPRSFGIRFKPRKSSAQGLSTSELLRTL